MIDEGEFFPDHDPRSKPGSRAERQEGRRDMPPSGGLPRGDAAQVDRGSPVRGMSPRQMAGRSDVDRRMGDALRRSGVTSRPIGEPVLSREQVDAALQYLRGVFALIFIAISSVSTVVKTAEWLNVQGWYGAELGWIGWTIGILLAFLFSVIEIATCEHYLGVYIPVVTIDSMFTFIFMLPFYIALLAIAPVIAGLFGAITIWAFMFVHVAGSPMFVKVAVSLSVGVITALITTFAPESVTVFGFIFGIPISYLIARLGEIFLLGLRER